MYSRIVIGSCLCCMLLFSSVSCAVSVVVLKSIRDVGNGPLYFLCKPYIVMLCPFKSLVFVSVFCIWSSSSWSFVLSKLTWFMHNQGRLSVLFALLIVLCM